MSAFTARCSSMGAVTCQAISFRLKCLRHFDRRIELFIMRSYMFSQVFLVFYSHALTMVHTLAIREWKGLTTPKKRAAHVRETKKFRSRVGKHRHKVLNEVETFCEALADAARVRVRICRNGFRRGDHASKLRVSRSRNQAFGVHILSKKMKGRQARKTGKITDSLTLCIGREWTAGPKAMSFAFQISQRQAGRECMVHAAMVASVQLNMLEALIQWVAQRNDLVLAMVAKSFDGASLRLRGRGCGVARPDQPLDLGSPIEAQRSSTMEIEAAEARRRPV